MDANMDTNIETNKEDSELNKIYAAAEQCNGEVTSDYSGRGMYGKQCYGIECEDDIDLLMAIGAAGLPKPCMDNMGQGFIAYWPKITNKSNN